MRTLALFFILNLTNNVSRPTEVTSKRPVTRKRTVVEVPKIVRPIFSKAKIILIAGKRYHGIHGSWPRLGSFRAKNFQNLIVSLWTSTKRS